MVKLPFLVSSSWSVCYTSWSNDVHLSDDFSRQHTNTLYACVEQSLALAFMLLHSYA